MFLKKQILTKKKYQEIKDHEKEVEELFSILVGNKDNQTPYVPHGPAMIDPPNLGKYNHKLQNIDEIIKMS